MALLLTKPPSEEPLSLDEAKADLRIESDFTDHDALLKTYIAAGRERAEAICNRALVQREYSLRCDAFPRGWSAGIDLPMAPLVSVQSIRYLDADGAEQTLLEAAYKVDVASEPGRVFPAYGRAWPYARAEVNAVAIAFTAGYGARRDVPTAFRTAILMYCKAHYEAAFHDAAGREYERRMSAFANLLLPCRVMEFR